MLLVLVICVLVVMSVFPLWKTLTLTVPIRLLAWIYQQWHPYNIWTVRIWTVKFPGNIWTVKMVRVRVKVGVRVSVRFRVRVRVRVSYDCPDFECPDYK